VTGARNRLRVTFAVILNLLASGQSRAGSWQAVPYLHLEDIDAAFAQGRWRLSKRVLNSVTPNAQVQLQAVSKNSGAEAAARLGFGMIASGLAARTPAGAGRGAALQSLSPV
jgi:hypothetical protein